MKSFATAAIVGVAAAWPESGVRQGLLSLLFNRNNDEEAAVPEEPQCVEFSYDYAPVESAYESASINCLGAKSDLEDAKAAGDEAAIVKNGVLYSDLCQVEYYYK